MLLARDTAPGAYWMKTRPTTTPRAARAVTPPGGVSPRRAAACGLESAWEKKRGQHTGSFQAFCPLTLAKPRGRRHAGWRCNESCGQFIPAQSSNANTCDSGSKIAAPGGVSAIARRPAALIPRGAQQRQDNASLTWTRPHPSRAGDRPQPRVAMNSRHSPLLMPEFSCVTASPFSIRRTQSSAVALIVAPPMR